MGSRSQASRITSSARPQALASRSPRAHGTCALPSPERLWVLCPPHEVVIREVAATRTLVAHLLLVPALGQRIERVARLWRQLDQTDLPQHLLDLVRLDRIEVLSRRP